MNIDSIIQQLLSKPKQYPGIHMKSAPRTTSACKPLEPRSQLHLIWKAFYNYINEKLSEGLNVYVKGFGAFAFDIATELPKTYNSFNKMGISTLDDTRKQRKNVHNVQPRFVVDMKLKASLLRYPGKEELLVSNSQHSIYQKGFKSIQCNPVPIAQACQMNSNIVKSGLDAMFKAIIDLTLLSRSIDLKLGFCSIVITNRDLKVYFANHFNRTMKMPDMEDKMRRSPVGQNVSKLWTTSQGKKWANSTLSTMQYRPDTRDVSTLSHKTQYLKYYSYDLASTAKLD